MFDVQEWKGNFIFSFHLCSMKNAKFYVPQFIFLLIPFGYFCVIKFLTLRNFFLSEIVDAC